MHTGYLIGSIILFVLSLGCIGTTVTQVIRREFGLGSMNFWGAVVFHVVTAIIAVFLLDRARSKKQSTNKEEQL